MRYVQIKNEGEVEVAGFSLMGASNKDGRSTIGFFGSGNKYALATLLREGIDFKIYTGVREVKVETERLEFNGTMYDRILVDGQHTSLTTRMGPDWELWFALREIVSNAKDEGGFELKVVDEGDIEPEENKTTILIEEEPFEEILKELESYIRGDGIDEVFSLETPFGNVIMLEPLSTERFNVYRKGISVTPENNNECMYWYDFESIDINESRTYKYEFQVRESVESAIARVKDERWIRKFLKRRRARPKTYEARLNLDQVGFSGAWYNVLKGHTIYPESALQFLPQEDTMRGIIVPDGAARVLSKEYPDLDIVGHGEKTYEVVEPSQDIEYAVERAFYKMMRIGYPVKCEIVYVKVFEEDTIAWYDSSTNKIYLCVNHIDPEREQDLMETLLEEQLHSQGMGDSSRRLVNYLIHELITEKLKKENKEE